MKCESLVYLVLGDIHRCPLIVDDNVHERGLPQ
jgi:hypothetical protein